MLVDKTPSYALHLDVLRRMESDFEEPLYIHLLRHPRAMVDSFEATKLDQVFFRYEHPYGVRELAELIWWESQCNIEALLADVPAERKLALRFEDLVARPRHSMERVCRFAGLEFEEAMLHPYRDPQAKMTDGLHGVSIMRGDPKFHRHSAIDPGVADRWRRNPAPDCLADGTWEVAERLGYRRRDAVSREVTPSGTGSAAVPVQPRGSRPPFFFVAGVQNHFRDRLGPDQPFYRLQMQKLAAEELLTRTEDMASWCLEGVKAIQPEGPYYLGGHCFGGVVAFEMAQQLRARGEEVALLVLAESYPAASRGELIGSRGWRLWQRLRYQLRQARRAGLRQELGHVGRGLRRRLREWLWRTTETYQDPRAANYRAQRSYVARSYAGSAVLLQCEERTRWRRGLPQNGWGELLEEGLEVHRVPGSHTGMYREPNVDVLCGILRARLRRAQQDRLGI
jgi:thioesterase domain-containing protein